MASVEGDMEGTVLGASEGTNDTFPLAMTEGIELDGA